MSGQNDELQLLIDLHKNADRQGPGGEAETQLAISLAGLSKGNKLTIADIGCGTGAQTITLAKALNADITAVDFLPDFLAELQQRARAAGVSSNIKTLAESMDALTFASESLDVIWSEGAVYNMGFENGVRNWRKFLKPGGIIALSELTWLTETRPDELHTHWTNAYPDVNTASAKFAILESCGYSPMAYFTLPIHCWLDNYYRPMQARFEAFLAEHNNSPAAQAIAQEEQAEISLYERYADFVSYGFYIAQKLPG